MKQNLENETKEGYSAPSISVVEIATEKGFAASGDPLSVWDLGNENDNNAW